MFQYLPFVVRSHYCTVLRIFYQMSGPRTASTFSFPRKHRSLPASCQKKTKKKPKKNQKKTKKNSRKRNTKRNKARVSRHLSRAHGFPRRVLFHEQQGKSHKALSSVVPRSRETTHRRELLRATTRARSRHKPQTNEKYIRKVLSYTVLILTWPVCGSGPE